MRQIDNIVLHCTATPQTTTIGSIRRYWEQELGWKSPGYHYIIQPDGSIVNIFPIEKVSNGVQGHNANSIHISYIGGVDAKGRARDNRTPEQKAAQIALIKELREQFPAAKILGHRDFPGVKKGCPSFDVNSWLKSVGLV